MSEVSITKTTNKGDTTVQMEIETRYNYRSGYTSSTKYQDSTLPKENLPIKQKIIIDGWK